MLGEPPEHWPQEPCGDEPGRMAFLASSKTQVAAVDDLVAIVVQLRTPKNCVQGVNAPSLTSLISRLSSVPG
jgi:hypothetical protein